MTSVDTTKPNEIDCKDFNVSKAYLAAPLGGLNEFSVDMSVVRNAPRANDGHPVVFIWGDPKKRFDYRAQGFVTTPAKWLHSVPPGGALPIELASQSVVETPEGEITKEGKMLLLLHTSHTNSLRLAKNRDDSIRRLNGTKVEDQAKADAEYLLREGIKTWEETKVERGHNSDYEPRRAVANPARISMSGPVAT
jgi:hypothetical protein